MHSASVTPVGGDDVLYRPVIQRTDGHQEELAVRHTSSRLLRLAQRMHESFRHHRFLRQFRQRKTPRELLICTRRSSVKRWEANMRLTLGSDRPIAAASSR